MAHTVTSQGNRRRIVASAQNREPAWKRFMKNVSPSDCECIPRAGIEASRLGASALCLFQQLIAAARCQRQHRQRRMLIACRRKRIAAEYIQIRNFVGTAERIYNS